MHVENVERAEEVAAGSPSSRFDNLIAESWGGIVGSQGANPEA